MSPLKFHIILIGFKHVGKSTIGKHLAEKLHASFIDLDQQVEMLYENQFNEKHSCRQIMHQHGELFFRDLEESTLSKVMNLKPAIISLGGGTPLTTINIQSSIIIHITAPRESVFERILKNGVPAFFNPHEDILKSFNELWDEKNKIYEEIKHFSIENNESIGAAVNHIIHQYESFIFIKDAQKEVDLA